MMSKKGIKIKQFDITGLRSGLSGFRMCLIMVW